jgi:serine protease Do
MSKQIQLSLAILAMLMFALATPSRAAVDPKTVREIYERVTPSLVVVQYTYDGEAGRRDLNTSGIVISDDGMVITTSAITPTQIPDEQMKDFKIIIPGDDEKEIPAEFLGRDDRSGLSFFRAKEKDAYKWAPIKFEDSPVQIGDDIVSVGLLYKDAGYKSYVMLSQVSATLRGPVPQVLVTGGGVATVGSPVFNAEGKAIGIVHAQGSGNPLLNDPREANTMSSTTSPPTLYVPARDFLASLSDPPKAGEPMKFPQIGVAQLTGLSKDAAEYFGLKGQPAVQVGDVIPGFPASKAGLKPGDVIVKMNGEPLERGDEPEETPAIMTRKIIRMHVGDKVTFSVLRGKDQPLTDLTVTLEERPAQANKAKRFFAEDLGFTARELMFEDTYARKLPANAKGVVVAYIKQSSSAQNAKLANSDLIVKLNQTPVENLAQFKEDYEAFRKEHPHDAVIMEVQRGRGDNTQVVRIEPPQ